MDTSAILQQVRRFAPAIGLLLVTAVFFPIGAGDVTLGVIVGLLTALIAIGLALIYRANRVINFAQGDLGTVPTTIVLGLTAITGLPWLLAFGIGLAAAIVLGVVIEFVIVRRPGFPAVGGSTLSATCSLADFADLDCPGIGDDG